MAKRVYNFAAGPSMLPLGVLESAAASMLDLNGSGQSAMEMSHRAMDFIPIIERAEKLLRELLGISDDYAVLFLQGGASSQFSSVPINLAGSEWGADAGRRKNAAYIDTGIWAGKALKEAEKFVNVRIAASSKDKNYTYIPKVPKIEGDNEYLHICLNNTIVGTAWREIPDSGGVILAADASSCLLSEPLDVSRFGLIYAGAQKNIGPAGCTLVIVRKDLTERAPAWTPLMLRYDIQVKERSLFNTPPCWCIYIIGLVLEHLVKLGGLSEMAKINRKKAALLYDTLESSRLFYSPVEKNSRSLMNIPFVVRDSFAAQKEKIESDFLARAAARGMVNLKGHRLVGGLRASIYNAMPLEGVEALADFIRNFEREWV